MSAGGETAIYPIRKLTAVIFAPKIAPKGIKLPPKRAAKWSIVRYPTKYKKLYR